MSSNQKQRKQRSRLGFSLLEMIVAMTVMSVISAVIMPIIVTATDSYAVARDTRAGTDRVLYALELSSRLVREAQFEADESGLAVQSATATQFILDDGSGIRLNGSEFELLDSTGESSILCTDVDRIQLTYFNSAGVAMVLVAPAQVHRVGLRIQSGPVVLDMYSMPRAWIGRGGP